MKENKIPAIYKEDLQKLLGSLNEYEPIINCQRHCIVCSKIITLDNLQLIIPRAGDIIEYVCNDTSCISTYNNIEKSK